VQQRKNMGWLTPAAMQAAEHASHKCDTRHTHKYLMLLTMLPR
jgi:hypothetical protein